MKWFRKAAAQGYATAQFSIGRKYALGEGVPKDSAEGLKWFRKAATRGEVHAQFTLGLMYANGEGVPKDEIEGLAWFNIVAASGDENGVKRRKILEQRVGREMTLAAQQRSKEILKQIEAAKRVSTTPAPK